MLNRKAETLTSAWGRDSVNDGINGAFGWEVGSEALDDD